MIKREEGRLEISDIFEISSGRYNECWRMQIYISGFPWQQKNLRKLIKLIKENYDYPEDVFGRLYDRLENRRSDILNRYTSGAITKELFDKTLKGLRKNLDLLEKELNNAER